MVKYLNSKSIQVTSCKISKYQFLFSPKASNRYVPNNSIHAEKDLEDKNPFHDLLIQCLSVKGLFRNLM